MVIVKRKAIAIKDYEIYMFSEFLANTSDSRSLSSDIFHVGISQDLVYVSSSTLHKHSTVRGDKAEAKDWRHCLLGQRALIGNVLVICVVCRNTSMHSVTNYFIVNLAVADLLVGLLCLPITLVANLISGENNAMFYHTQLLLFCCCTRRRFSKSEQ